MIRAPFLLYSTILGCATALLATPLFAAEDLNTKELLSLSLTELSNVEVTSVSKKSEKESEAAAAIFVITQNDIRESGMTSIPEVLRMVPGLDVAQTGSHGWAVSSRGFNDEFANKLLVLIDGRTVYDPLFSGVYWDVQDTPMQDVERIEVIRGPGATLWGANAVNGVINIITKAASETQGEFVSQTIGTNINSGTTVRYGAKVDDNAYVRAYAKYDDMGSFKLTNGGDAHDQWNKGQAGFRSDWKSGGNQTFTFQGDVYNSGQNDVLKLPSLATGTQINTVSDREVATGGNLLARWDNKVSKDSDFTFQMYYDDAKRFFEIYSNNIQTFDMELQHAWTPTEGHDVVWGAGYRLVAQDINTTPYLQLKSDAFMDSLLSAFVQDKITIVPKKFYITLGSKFEYNTFTQFEYQPSARFTWLMDEKNTVWGAVSRAVHTPDRGSQDLTRLVGGPLAASTFAAKIGNENTTSEELIAYELGYRTQLARNVSLDVSSFYNDYRKLLLGVPGPTLTPTIPGLGAVTLITVSPVNVGSAHSWGGEASINWKPTNYAELVAGYTLLELKFDQADPYGFSFANKTPEQQFNIRSNIKLPYDVEWNTALYYVDDLSALKVDNYYRLDTRLAWKPIDSLELSLVGQNLLDPRHQEFMGFLYQNNTQVPRTIYGNITWKF